MIIIMLKMRNPGFAILFQSGFSDVNHCLKGLCKDISVHLHREEKSKNSPLKLMATCVVNNR